QGNFKRKGNESELIANFQLLNRNESISVINQNVELKISGSESRSFPVKSISLTPQKAFGKENFNFKMFDNLDDTVFDQVILYSGGGDFPWTGWEPNYFERAILRDVYIHQLVKNNGFGIKEYEPVIVFINGEFWGVQTLREAFSKDYFNRHFNLSDIDLLSDNASILLGSNIDYNTFLNNLSLINPLSQDFIPFVESKIDVNSYFDYVISEIFIHNTDWPNNNIKFWRYRNFEMPSDSLYFTDGRYRWLFYDADIAFGLYDLSYNNFKNDFEYYLGEQENLSAKIPWESFLIRHLLLSPELRDLFVERFGYHLLNTFNPEQSLLKLENVYIDYKSVMPLHLNRWCNNFYSFSDWEESINQMRVFAVERPCEIREMLKEYFDIQNPMYAFGVCDSDYFDSDNFCENVFVFPNPTSDIITIKISQGKHYACKIDLYNSFGEVLMFKDYHVFDTELRFNISALPQAVYYIRIECGELSCVKKIVKI
ncbi:MAG: CotH kinase family protein, partial [Bacteroidales bacterium]|nr:CotH kinase family protein [Bacteroidales bacterium]